MTQFDTEGVSDEMLMALARRDFFSLNPVGGAVWALLETPASGHEIAAALHEVFPDVPIDTVADDLALLLGQMALRGLVIS